MLIIDSSAKRKIAALRQIAEQFPIPEAMMAYKVDTTAEDHEERSRELRVFLQNSTLVLENYTVTFTVEQRTYGTVRHLAIMIPDRTPEKAAVRVLLDEFGITTPLGLCLVTEERFGRGGYSMHIAEPIERTPAFEQELRKRTYRIPVAVA